jgi:SAM-dependent methyltransferase
MPDTSPYTVLAAGYDLVMRHVDYEAWAEYAADLLDEYAPDASSILELGAGTGTLAAYLQPMGPGEDGFRYVATDASPQMMARAGVKLAAMGEEAPPVRLAVLDAREAGRHAATLGGPFDAALFLYDGLNYLLDEADVRRMLQGVADALVPGGVFVMDQSTPANSINNEADFSDEGRGEVDGEPFTFVRTSRYDSQRGLHTTRLDLTHGDQSHAEEHVQRAYSKADIERLVGESPLQILAAYDGFSADGADDDSERIHWVIRKTV